MQKTESVIQLAARNGGYIYISTHDLPFTLLLAVRGEGEWKKVATGFFICLGDYLAPWLFGMIPGLFNF